MANEFVARNGLIAQNNSTITGSLNVTAGITGSLLGTASFASTASYITSSAIIGTVTSASYALTASFASTSQTASYVLNAISSSYAATSSYADNFTVANTLTAQTLVVQTITSSTDYVTGSSRFGSLLTNTHQFTGSVNITGSLSLNGNNVITSNQTSSFVINSQTSSFVTNAQTSSMLQPYVLNSATSSFVTSNQTSSFVTNNQTSSFVQNNQTSSMLAPYVLSSATSSFVTNSQTSSFVLNNQTSSMTVLSSSFATTASYVQTAQTASYVLNAISSSYALTASYALNAGTAVSTASLLTTASVLLNTITFTKGDGSTFPITVNTGSGGGGSTFPYTGSAIISGSLIVTGSVSSTQGFTGSLQGTSSWATNAITSSYANNLTVAGTLTAQTIVAQTITSSTEWITGSTKFGNIVSNTHQFTGSVGMTGSLSVNGTTNITNTSLSPFQVISGSTPLLTVSSSGGSNSGAITVQVGQNNWNSGILNVSTNGLKSVSGSTPLIISTTETGAGSVYPHQLVFRYEGTSSGWGIESVNQGVTYTPLLLNKNGGNVGIGTTTPSYTLDVNGSSRFRNGTQVTGSTEISGSLSVNGNVNIGGPSVFDTRDLNMIGNVKILTGYGGNGYFRLSDTGPGASAPTTIQTTFGNTFISNNITYDTTNGFTYNESSYAGSFIQMEPSVGQILFYTAPVGTSGSVANYTQSLRITEGKVGIRMSTTPAYELDVSGSINFTGTLYQNGSPFGGGGGSGSAFPYTGSAGINGDLSVYNTTSTTVASFEGVNGFPIQIITTSGSLTAGYTADTGSIGNGDGILYLKTGSSDPDWAPIAYDNHLVQQTYTGIDLSGGDYTILGPGIYEITNAQTNDLIFPDPASFTGQRIVVINTDGSNIAFIDNTNTWAPYAAGTGTQLGGIGVEDMWEFISINSKWRGIKSGK